MKHNLAILLAPLVLGSSFLNADTLKLKSGTSHEGALISETPDEYTFKVQITKSIKEERKFKKADVESLTKDDPGKAAFDKINPLKISDDFLTTEDYDVNIRTVTAFLDTNKASSYVKDAEAILSKLKDEREKAASGSVKVNGLWATKEQQMLNQYDFDASAMQLKAKSRGSKGDVRGALNLLDQMEKDFSGASSLDEALELKKTYLQQYAALINSELAEFPFLKEKRMKGLQTLSPTDMKSSKMAADNEMVNYQAIIKSEKEKGIKWISTFKYSDKEMKEQLTAIKTEQTRIAARKPVSGESTGMMFKKAQEAIRDGNSVEAKRLVTAIGNGKIAPKYNESLTAGLASVEKKAAEMKAAEMKAAEEAKMKAAEEKKAKK